jgi:YHS domain-containing protein
MDAESLKSLGSLLLWGGLFFVMMRYGCGAHMMGGHGHGGHGNAPPDGNTKDPVCGMSVDPQKAAAAAMRAGVTYYFCSTSCRDKFEQTPDKYPGPAAAH